MCREAPKAPAPRGVLATTLLLLLLWAATVAAQQCGEQVSFSTSCPGTCFVRIVLCPTVARCHTPLTRPRATVFQAANAALCTATAARQSSTAVWTWGAKKGAARTGWVRRVRPWRLRSLRCRVPRAAACSQAIVVRLWPWCAVLQCRVGTAFAVGTRRVSRALATAGLAKGGVSCVSALKTVPTRSPSTTGPATCTWAPQRSMGIELAAAPHALLLAVSLLRLMRQHASAAGHAVSTRRAGHVLCCRRSHRMGRYGDDAARVSGGSRAGEPLVLPPRPVADVASRRARRGGQCRRLHPARCVRAAPHLPPALRCADGGRAGDGARHGVHGGELEPG